MSYPNEISVVAVSPIPCVSQPLTVFGIEGLQVELIVQTEADVEEHRGRIPDYAIDWLRSGFRRGSGPLKLVPLRTAPPGSRVIGPAPMYCQACGAKL